MQTSALHTVAKPRRAAGPSSCCSDRSSDGRNLAELARRAGGEGGRRRALAVVAGRLVATRAWERLGFARLSDYAVERAGVSARQLQELARVDVALAELPAVEAALVAGELSWTKARLLCRAATPRDERAWCTIAACLSARELAREVRRVDVRSVERVGASGPGGAGVEPSEEARETLHVHCSDGVRARWLLACRVAERAAGESLPRWACAQAVAAEAFAAVGLPAAPAGSPDAFPFPAAPASARLASPLPRASASSSSTPAPPDPLLVGLGETDAFELDARLRRGLRHEQRRLVWIGPLLLQIASDRLFRARGLDSGGRAGAAALARALASLASRLARARQARDRAAPEGRRRRCYGAR